MLFAVCSDRGAPGSTTVALALAAARGLPALVVEADPYGGDLPMRIRQGGQPLPATPTVLSVAAGRSAQQPVERAPLAMPQTLAPGARYRDLWRDGSHQLSELVRLVPGFGAAEHGTSLAWPVLADALQAQATPVFADLGRIHTGSPSMPIAAAADALITVCRGDMASVQHMADRLSLLVPAIAEQTGRPPLVVPVVVAPRKHGSAIATSVADVLAQTAVEPALRGVAWLAWDPAGVHRLFDGEDPWGKPLGRSALMRSARRVMWLLGMATSLEHTDPTAGGRTGLLSSITRRGGGRDTQQAPVAGRSPAVGGSGQAATNAVPQSAVSRRFDQAPPAAAVGGDQQNSWNGTGGSAR